MKKLIKNNLISLLIMIFSFSGLSFATTYVRPYGPSDYAGGAKAVGQKVNDEFQDLADFINNGNIASGNIAGSGVLSDNIADGAVTPEKLSDSNLKVTSSSSLFINTGSLADVTNLSTTITTNGRPILIKLEQDFSTYLVNNINTFSGSVYSSDSAGAGSFLSIVRDSSTLSAQSIPYQGASSTNRVPCSAYTHIDYPSAGAYTYKISIGSASGVSAYVSGCKLIVVEI